MPRFSLLSWLVALRARSASADGLRSDAGVRWACIGFLLGVLIHNARPLETMPWWIPTALIAAGVALGRRVLSWGQRGAIVSEWCYLFSGQRGALPLLLVFMGLGMWRFDLTLPSVSDSLYLHLGERISMKVKIEDLGKYDAIMRVIEIDGVQSHSRSKLSVASAGKGMKIGEMWRVVCRVERNEKTELKQVLFDARKGIFYRCRGSISAQRIVSSSSWNLSSMLMSWRSILTTRIYRLIPGDEGALLGGILYGERGLSMQENQAFRMAGMTHLIAVSGSNITIVISLFVPLFLAFGYRRRSAIWLSGIAVALFALFVGAGASVLRAALMGWLAILARAFGRRADANHLLLLVGAMMIALDPWALGFDAGFALSFLATWGLLVPGRVIKDSLKWVPEIFELRETLATTFAASLATAPFQMWAFGSVSLLGLITNIFAIPLTAFTMAWGSIAIAFGDLWQGIVYPARGMLAMMLAIAGFAERFPMLVIQYKIPLPLFLCVMTAGIVYFSIRVNREKISTV